MATIRILLGIFCLALTGWGNNASSDFLKFRVNSLALREKHFVYPSEINQAKRERLLFIARSQLGVREATGNNDGKEVESYLKYTANKKGEPWCASFVSWVFGQAGYAKPKTAWSPALFPMTRQLVNPAPATVFGIYFTSLKRIAHCGFVEDRHGDWLITIEGNTNVDGSREGDGVYRKRRNVKSVTYFADWMSEKRRERKDAN